MKQAAMKQAALAVMAAAIALPAQVSAHFLLEYTEETMISRPGDLPVKLIFWHPFENGFVMEMDRPRAFFMVHRGDRTDLLDRLQPTPFTGAENTATAWRGTVPVKRSGDYILVTVPEPYYEESEDKFIQQIAKTVVNRYAMPTDWMTPVGLPTEILPLTKPYNVLVGSSFTGRVLSGGQPVAGAEIEIEFMAATPDMDRATATPATVSPPPGGAMVLYSDAGGYFTFAVPRAGRWGFAALGVGPDTEHDGKALSQDAVLWIHAWDLE
jgi:cobalt/nickel transport protein